MTAFHVLGIWFGIGAACCLVQLVLEIREKYPNDPWTTVWVPLVPAFLMGPIVPLGLLVMDRGILWRMRAARRIEAERKANERPARNS